MKLTALDLCCRALCFTPSNTSGKLASHLFSDPECQLTRYDQPFTTINVFDPLVYGPMTLLILGFTEAASRRREQRSFYSFAAIFICLIVLAEVGWAAHGAVTCAKDAACTARQEVKQPDRVPA